MSAPTKEVRVSITRNFALGMGLGDYAAKALIARGCAQRAVRNGRDASHHRDTARRMAAVCRAIREQFPKVAHEPDIYFAVAEAR